MGAQLESGAVKHLEEQVLEAAEEALSGQQFEISATQHAPGDQGIGVESVIIEVTADVDDPDIQTELMDHAYEEFVGSEGNLVSQAVQHSHDTLRSYGSSNDYSVDSVIDSFAGVEANRGDGTLTIGYGWGHVATTFYERGTSDHTVHGNPVLSFVWEDPPGWVREEFDQDRSSGGQFASGWRVFLPDTDPSGIPESRFVRSGLRWLESEVGG